MANVVLVGAQWGDEGKAKVTDLLSKNADLIVRVQGGCNAGHTVVVNDNTFKFHLIPSGILYGDKICIIGAGTVINPEVLNKELESLKEKNISVNRLYISPKAHVTLPFHIDFDKGNETKAGKRKIGTTHRGIGPTYSDKYARIGLRVEDFTEPRILVEKLEWLMPLKNALLKDIYGMSTYTVDEIYNYCMKYRFIFEKHMSDVTYLLQKAVNNKQNILFEGAQGTMLDIDHGTYPYVTSSNSSAGGACTGAGLGPSYIDRVIGVSKAYVTRVGEGPFATELNDETGKAIQDIGHEFGTTTGRARRCGWFDALVANYAVFLNSLDCMAITKLDVFDSFDEIKLCVAYRDKRNNTLYDYYPCSSHLLKYLEPVYETYPGWKTSIQNCRSFDELPENAKKYLKRIEELIGIPVAIVGVGPNRDQTIVIEDPIHGPKRELLTKV
ncbi:MAG: adenylosuccinate synthase [Cyanobacteriota bacterium]